MIQFQRVVRLNTFDNYAFVCNVGVSDLKLKNDPDRNLSSG